MDLAAVAVVGRFQGPAMKVEHLDVAHVRAAEDELEKERAQDDKTFHFNFFVVLDCLDKMGLIGHKLIP